MSLDLNELLRDWPHEPGQLKVRKIVGLDGKEKIQLRIDLGLIQMETSGRPDGQRPHDAESLLEYYRRKVTKAEKKGEVFSLNAEEVSDLQQEGIQYYHRYISLFQLGEHDAVIRDTQRNLDMFSFVEKYSDNEDLCESVIQFTPYVLMMNTRARATMELDRDEYAAGIRAVEQGMKKIRDFYDEQEMQDAPENSPELSFLSEWLDDIRAKQPLSKLEKMEREMKKAVDMEMYERAAELRDQIRSYQQKRQR